MSGASLSEKPAHGGPSDQLATRFAVVICTRLRPAELRRTLHSIIEAAPPGVPWRLLVVDNAGDAATAAEVDAVRDRLPVELVVEPTPGLSRARNRAVTELENESIDYIVWTDDDVTVDAQWLCGYAAAFDAHPDAAFFGGAIRPQFEGTPPRWLAANFGLVSTAYATRAVGTEDDVIASTKQELPFGANYAVRMAEQRACRYDTRLGRQPGRLLTGGEETEMLLAIVETGGRGRWVPAAVVAHRIGRDRQRISYLRRYYTGGSFAFQLKQVQRPGRRVALRRAVISELRYRQARLTRRPERWLPALLSSSQRRGALIATLRMNSTRRRGR